MLGIGVNLEGILGNKIKFLFLKFCKWVLDREMDVKEIDKYLYNVLCGGWYIEE